MTVRAAIEWAARLTTPTVRVPTATTVTMATAGTGRTATRSTASTAAGRVRRSMMGRGVPRTSSGGTARVSNSRWSTSATSSQWLARSPSGQVRAAARRTTPPRKRSFWRPVAAWPERRVAQR